MQMTPSRIISIYTLDSVIHISDYVLLGLNQPGVYAKATVSIVIEAILAESFYHMSIMERQLSRQRFIK